MTVTAEATAVDDYSEYRDLYEKEGVVIVKEFLKGEIL